MTVDTTTAPRTSPTGRVPLWVVLEDALAGVADRAWPDLPAAELPTSELPASAVPAQRVHRATARPGPSTLRGQVGHWVLDRTIIVVASTVLAVLGVLGLGD